MRGRDNRASRRSGELAREFAAPGAAAREFAIEWRPGDAVRVSRKVAGASASVDGGAVLGQITSIKNGVAVVRLAEGPERGQTVYAMIAELRAVR